MKRLLLLCMLCVTAGAQETVSGNLTFLTEPDGLGVYRLDRHADIPPEEIGLSGRPIQFVENPKRVLRIRFGWNGCPTDPQSEIAIPVASALRTNIYPADGKPLEVNLSREARAAYDSTHRNARLLRYGLVILGVAGAAGAGALILLPLWRKRQSEVENHRRLQALMTTIDVTLDPFVGKKFGNYLIVGKLGQGGMATVYRAVPPSLDEKEAVALKLIRGEEASSKEFRARFIREIDVCSKLQHPSVVKVMDSGEQDGALYLVMELVHGHTLRSRLVRGGMPLREAARYIKPIFSAVHYAHTQRVVHRDLKPDNIMVTGSGRIVVMDFGLARRHDFETVTVSGGILGTPAYMAPEQIQGGGLQASIDQYALGVMVFEMLTGETPFSGTHDPVQLILKHIGTAPDSMRKLRPKLTPELDAAVLKMLAKDPADRYPDVGAACEVLLKHLTS
jgi:tRNA A-37 threonylcarbamoyl transferase component Bud32